MPDVLSLLNVPDPAAGHGAAAPLPPDYQAILADWPGTPQEFFRTSGTADEAIRAARLAAPGLIFGDAAEQSEMAPETLAALQARVTALAGQDHPQRILLSGPIQWDGTLEVDDVAGLTLDFSAASLTVLQDSAPLIRITRSHRVTLRCLRIGQRNQIAVDIADSQDVALMGSALAGSADTALRLSGGARRVLVDRCAFLRNMGPAIRALGEVQGLVIARCAFDGPARRSFVEVLGALSARGYAAPVDTGTGTDAPARDALTLMQPTDVRILENRFGASDEAAISASGIRGLWVERNDFAASSQGALLLAGPSVGAMVADNRIQAAPDSAAALIRVQDTALACVFRNIFEPQAQPALLVAGDFGGIVVAANSLLFDIAPDRGTDVNGIILEPGAGFLSTTLMLNTIRGPIGAGVLVTGPLPRMFLFDNHLLGMTRYSLESRSAQPMATSVNNWSPVKSLNLPLSEQLIETARLVRDAAAG